MHIPDGFLEPPVWIGAAAVSAVGVGWALRRTARELDDRQVPLLGMTGAFIFAAQMVNFPILPGTSGHLVGGVLAASLLGPAPAVVVVTVVLAVQCFVFQDGGLTALGANVFNMAIIGAYGGYLFSRAFAALLGPARWKWAVALGAWASVVVAALACALELWLSGAVTLRAGILLIGGVHALIGVGEAAITVAVLAFLHRTRPDLVAFPMVASAGAHA